MQCVLTFGCLFWVPVKDTKSQCSNHRTSPLFSIVFLLLLTFLCIKVHITQPAYNCFLVFKPTFNNCCVTFLLLGVFVCVQVNIYHMHTHRGQKAALRERFPLSFAQAALFPHCIFQAGWHTNFQVFLHFPSPIEVLGLQMCAAVFGLFPGHPAFVASALTCRAFSASLQFLTGLFIPGYI